MYDASTLIHRLPRLALRPLIFLLGAILLHSPALAQTRQGYLRESFEGRTFPPAGWQSRHVSGQTQWQPLDFSALDDTLAALVYPVENDQAENWLITPRFLVQPDDSLKFWLLPFLGGTTPDSLAVKVSVTDSALTSFRTVALFESHRNYPNSGWYEQMRLSLRAYAGRKVYVAFKHVHDNGGGLNLDYVELGATPPADVRLRRIDVALKPAAGQAITPKVVVQNVGNDGRSFTLTLTTQPGGYSSTRTVRPLHNLEEADVTFNSWTPPAGTYTYTATAALAGDASPADNVRQVAARVYNRLPLPGWRLRDSLPEIRVGHGATSYRSADNDTTYLLAVGGGELVPGVGIVSDGKVWRYNTRTRTWARRADAPRLMTYMHAQNLRNKIYVAGGVPGFLTQPTNELSIYDPRTNTWASGAPLPTPTVAYGSVVLGDSLLYVVGGLDGQAASTHRGVQVYNVRTNAWQQATPWPGPAATDYMGLSLVGHTIIAAGGSSDHQSSAAYYRAYGRLDQAWRGDIDPDNPLSISWTPLPPYPAGPTRHLSAAGAVVNGLARVYFLGGDSYNPSPIQSEPVMADLWAYDLQSNEWVLGPPKPRKVNFGGLHAVTVGDSVYLAVLSGFRAYFNARNYGTAAQEWLALGKVGGPLPVTLTGYTARRQGRQALLEWHTAAEHGSSGFELAVSDDGRTFRPLAFVPAAGSGTAPRSYRYADEAPAGASIRYYRLTQRDLDGTRRVLGIRPVQFEARRAAVAVFPNPAADQATAWITLPTQTPEVVTLELLDGLGRVCWQRQVAASGSFREEAVGAGLPAGLYVLRCRAGLHTAQTRLVKR